MFKCPSCHEKGIGVWSKMWSGSGSPAKCKECSKLSYVHSKHYYGFKFVWVMLVTWALIASLIYTYFETDYLAPLILIPFVWLAGRYVELAVFPLTPITKDEALKRNKFGYIFLLILATLLTILLI